MNRWRVKVQDVSGQARIFLMDGQNTVGVVTMSWGDYAMLCRALVQFVRKTSFEAIKETLMRRIWADAQRLFDNSAELAMLKLREWDWNENTIQSYSDEVSRDIVKTLVGFLPEHVL